MARSGLRARIRRPATLLAFVASLGTLAACGAHGAVQTREPTAARSAPGPSPQPSAPGSTVTAAGSAADVSTPAATGAIATAQATATAYEVGVELPPGAGREILLAECLSCHTLGALDLFKAFYRRDDWHALVLTMVEHGARVDPVGIELLSDYLAEHFGAEPFAPDAR